ncbi:AAA family ATPase [Nemania abortiva]|nr:AAA family ATPase [Nemania abortiva]
MGLCYAVGNKYLLGREPSIVETSTKHTQRPRTMSSNSAETKPLAKQDKPTKRSRKSPEWNNDIENDPLSIPKKKPRCEGAVAETRSPLVIHIVRCDEDGCDDEDEYEPAHNSHPLNSYFKDVPALYRDDTKASLPRGMDPILDLQEYRELHEDAAVTIFRWYDCVTYHRSLKDEFHKVLTGPKLAKIPSELRPYCFSLRRNGPKATMLYETMEMSQNLTSTLDGILQSQHQILPPNSSQKSPYLLLYHSQPLLKQFLNDAKDQRQIDHVRVLSQYLETFDAEYEGARAQFATGTVSKSSFNKLFEPGDLVLAIVENEPSVFKIVGCPQPSDSTQLQTSFAAYNWLFNGVFYQCTSDWSIAWPNEAKDKEEIPITVLYCYPLKYNGDRLADRLKERGEILWKCRHRQYVDYNAPRQILDVQTVSSRYMIDMKMYNELHTTSPMTAPPDSVYLTEEDMRAENPPDTEMIFLLPSSIRGFGMSDKKWHTLMLEYIQPVTWNKTAFERLVLESSKKELIKALVHIHMSNSESADIIEGKGNGLIVLLHGGPGTGKTLTAESVAELAERPLYRVTCGDIGTDPEEVEKYLESAFYIGNAWKAVVLLDESDVFLEERTQADLQRNALVSVFLRAIEYYDGILILTSNRVGSFDEAFKSRVQLAMHYPPLTNDSRLEIWMNFFNMLQESGRNANIRELKNKVDVLARQQLNGRQIRNAIRTASQLAMYRQETMSFTHLEQTIRITNEFEEYIEKTHGHTAKEWAQSQNLRLE